MGRRRSILSRRPRDSFLGTRFLSISSSISSNGRLLRCLLPLFLHLLLLYPTVAEVKVDRAVIVVFQSLITISNSSSNSDALSRCHFRSRVRRNRSTNATMLQDSTTSTGAPLLKSNQPWRRGFIHCRLLFTSHLNNISTSIRCGRGQNCFILRDGVMTMAVMRVEEASCRPRRCQVAQQSRHPYLRPLHGSKPRTSVDAVAAPVMAHQPIPPLLLVATDQQDSLTETVFIDRTMPMLS